MSQHRVHAPRPSRLKRRDLTVATVQVAIIGALALWSLYIWNGATRTPIPLAAGDSGTIIAFSETPASTANFWVGIDALRPAVEGSEEPRLRLQYGITPKTGTDVSVSWAISEHREMIGVCDSALVDVTRHVQFEDLPQVARVAAFSDDDGADDEMTRNERLSQNTYSLVSFDTTAQDTEFRSGDATENRLYASGTVECAIKPEAAIWQQSSAGSRLTTPDVIFGATGVASDNFYGQSSANVPTDDSFYFVRGNIDPSSDEVGYTEFQQTLSAKRYTSEPSVLSGETDAISVLFSGYRPETDRDTDVLLTGVLLGAAVSLTIELLTSVAREFSRPRESAAPSPAVSATTGPPAPEPWLVRAARRLSRGRDRT